MWIAIAYPAATRSRLDGTCVYPLTYARYPGTYDQCPLLCLCRYLLFVLEECSRWIRHIPLAPRVWGVWPRTGNVRPPKPPLPLLTSRAGSATCSLLFVRAAQCLWHCAAALFVFVELPLPLLLAASSFDVDADAASRSRARSSSSPRARAMWRS